MKMPVAPQKYIIQVDLLSNQATAVRGVTGAPVGLKAFQRLLDGTGIKLDPHYRPVCVNAQRQRFVVRGEATPEARLRAEQMLGDGIRFIPDGTVQTLSAHQKSR